MVLFCLLKKIENKDDIFIYEFDFVGYDTSKELLTEFDTNIDRFLQDL